MEPGRVEILSFGDELVLGEIADTNAAYMAAALSTIGVAVVRTSAVGDSLSDMKASISRALESSRLVIATGGLGPTQDDLTRQAVAEVIGTGLEYHPEVIEAMAARFDRKLEDIAENNRRQGYIPDGSTMLPNAVGTAPGFLVERDGCALFALPGVPHEMKHLFAEYVLPYARKHVASGSVALRRLHLTGLGESEIDRRLGELIAPDRNPSVGTKVLMGTCTIRIMARAGEMGDAEQMVADCEAQVRERLGDSIFGSDEDTVEQSLVKTLTGSGLTVAVAESCTGGLMSARITSVPGASAALVESVVTYSNESKVKRLGVNPDIISARGAVSDETAEAMAKGVRATSGADLAVAVTGIAGPGGGTTEKPVGTVHIAVAGPGRAASHRKKFHPPREAIRERAANAALLLLLQEAVALATEKERCTECTG